MLFGNIYAKVDFQVRGAAQLGTGANATRNELPESLLATVRGVPGVEAAEGEVTGYAQFVARDGKAISTGGAPTLAVAFDPDQQISPLHLIAGGPPVTPDDVVMDAGTAQKYDFTVGQTVSASCRPVHPGPSLSPASPSSARRTTWPEPRWPRSRCRPRRPSPRRPASSTPSTW